MTEGGGFVMAYDWKQWYGVDQNTYNKEKQRISQAITTYGAKGDLASIQKAQKHQQMFEQAYKGIDPNTGQKFSSSQSQPTLFSNQGQGSMPWVNPYADDLMGSFFDPIDFSGAESAAKQTTDYQYGRLQNQVDTAGQRLLDSYNSGLRRTEDDFNYAKGNLEKASHLDRLRAKESLVASGNADSSAGLADMDTRLALAKQDNLTDLARGYQRQNEDLTDQYNSGQQALADQLAQFDYTKIYNDAFAPLQQAIMEAQQGKQKTLMELYKGAQDQYNEDRKYTDITADKRAGLNFDYANMNNSNILDLIRHFMPSGSAQLSANTEMNKWNTQSANNLADNYTSAYNAGLRAQNEGSGDMDFLKVLSTYQNGDPITRQILEMQYPGLASMNSQAGNEEISLALDGMTPDNTPIEDVEGIIKNHPNLSAKEKNEALSKVRTAWTQHEQQAKVVNQNKVNANKAAIQEVKDQYPWWQRALGVPLFEKLFGGK